MAVELATAYISVMPSMKGFAPAVNRELGATAKATSKGSKKVGGGIGAGLMSGAKKAVGVAGIGAAIVGGAVIKGGISRLLDIEDAQAKLKGLGHSTKGVQSIMDNALSSVKGTSYGMGEAATTAASAVAAGIKPGKELTKYLKLTGDAATIAGTSMGDMGAIMNKVTTAGKVQTEELNQLSERGIPALKWLQDEYGVTAGEMRKMVSDGKVDAKTFRKVINENIGGAALESGNTTRGAFKNMLAALGRVGANLMSSVFPHFKNLFSGITNLLAPAEKAATRWGEAIGKAIGSISFGSIADDARKVAGALSPVIDAAKQFGQDLGSAFATAAPALGDVAKALAPMAKALAKLALGSLVAAFKLLGPLAKGVAAGFAELAKHKTVVQILAGTAGAIFLGVKAFKAYKAVVGGIKAIQEAYTLGTYGMKAATGGFGTGLANAVGKLKGYIIQVKSSSIWTKIAAGSAKVWKLMLAGFGWVKQTAQLIAHKVAVLATNAAQKAAALGARLWAAGQWLLNAAMSANPIGLLVAGIALLVAGFVLAWKKSATFRKVLTAAWNGIKAAANKAWSILGPIFRAIARFAGAVVVGAFKALRNIAVGAFKLVAGAGRKLWKALGPAFTNIGRGVRKVGGFFKGLWTDARAAFNNIVTGIKSVPGRIVALVGRFKSAGKAIIRGLIDGLKNAGGFISDIAGSVWNGVKGMLNAAIKKINAALEFTIPVIGKKVNPPDIPTFARGGRVTGSTFAVIGEGAEPETVLPDSLLGRLLSKAAKGDLDKAPTKKVAKPGQEKAEGTFVADLNAKKFKTGANDMSRSWTRRVKPVYDGWRTSIKKKVQPAVTSLDRQARKAFTQTIPRAAAVMGQRVRNEDARTGKSLIAFGGIIRSRVAPAVGRGVDAISRQWARVRNVAKGPVRYMVGTVLNNGLLRAFNKVAKFVSTKGIGKISLPGFRTGGKVPGQGAGDKVLLRAEPGEFILRKKRVAELERHNPGVLDRINKGRPRRGRGTRLSDIEMLLGGEPPGYKDGGLIPSVKKAQNFARSQAGKPYIWGGVGPAGYDCSGFMSAITNVLRGNPPHSRLGATGSMPWPGFGSGPGMFSLGWFTGSPGHTAGNLAGLNVESRGGEGVVVGSRARGAGDSLFNRIMHLGTAGGAWLKSGGGALAPALPKWAQKIVDSPTKWAKAHLAYNGPGKGSGYGRTVAGLLNKLAAPAGKWAKGKLNSYGPAGGGGLPGGGSGSTAQAFAKSLLRSFGWGPDQWPPLRSLWNKESGWRVNADNPTSSAYGIPQMMLSAHNVPADYKSNFRTQVKVGMRYIKGRYGSPSGAWGHSQSVGWYGNGLEGGVFSKPTLIGVGERGPERVDVTPLSGREGLASKASGYTPAAVGRARGGQVRFDMAITNWDEGTGFIAEIAQDEIAGDHALDREIARASR